MAVNKLKNINTDELDWLYPEQVCRLLDIDKRTLINWTDKEETPCPSKPNDGTRDSRFPRFYEWEVVLAWYVRREINKALKRLGSAPVDKADADFRNASAAATLKEMKILQQCGQLVEASQIADVWTNKIQTAKKLLLTIPHKAAQRLGDGLGYQERKTIIEEEIEAALTSLGTVTPLPEAGSVTEDEEEAS